MDDQQRARAQFEAWASKFWTLGKAKWAGVDRYRSDDCEKAWDAWQAATEEMLSAAYPRNERIDDSFDRLGAWADCIAARPQGVK